MDDRWWSTCFPDTVLYGMVWEAGLYDIALVEFAWIGYLDMICWLYNRHFFALYYDCTVLSGVMTRNRESDH